MNDEKQKIDPEIDVALVFAGIIIALQVLILGIIGWNTYQDRKMQGQTNPSAQTMKNELEQMQKEFFVVKTSLTNINSSLTEIDKVCHGNAAKSEKNLISLGALRQKFSDNKAHLSWIAPVLKNSYGNSASAAVQNYIHDLDQIKWSSDICFTGPYYPLEWKNKADKINEQLMSTLASQVEKASKAFSKGK